MNTHAQAAYPRYVAATLLTGSYVVYDRWRACVADGQYLTLEDAQWSADQRNRQQWHAQWSNGQGNEQPTEGAH